MGSERTFSENLTCRDAMLAVLTTLGQELLIALDDRQLSSETMQVKVRFGNFETLTRAYTHSAGAINNRVYNRVLPYLLDRALGAQTRAARVGYRSDKPGVRLLGVSFGSLSEQVQTAPRQLEIDL